MIEHDDELIPKRGAFDLVVTLPDGRQAGLILCRPHRQVGQRVARAIGALYWGVPNKAMIEAVSVVLPDWPPEVYAWRVTRRDLCALTMPGHDAGPMRVLDWIGRDHAAWPSAAAPWECVA